MRVSQWTLLYIHKQQDQYKQDEGFTHKDSLGGRSHILDLRSPQISIDIRNKNDEPFLALVHRTDFGTLLTTHFLLSE